LGGGINLIGCLDVLIKVLVLSILIRTCHMIIAAIKIIINLTQYLFDILLIPRNANK